MSTTYTIEVPDRLGLTEHDIKMLLVGQLFENGELSAGQAADIVGITKRTFIETAGQYGVSIFGYDGEELLQDIANA